MYSAAIAPGSRQCACATACQHRPTASINGCAAPEIASAETNFASVLGMYTNPVSDSRPTTSRARKASHPLLPPTSHPNTSIRSLASIVSACSATNRGHAGTRPAAFSAAGRRYAATASPRLRRRARLYVAMNCPRALRRATSLTGVCPTDLVFACVASSTTVAVSAAIPPVSVSAATSNSPPASGSSITFTAACSRAAFLRAYLRRSSTRANSRLIVEVDGSGEIFCRRRISSASSGVTRGVQLARRLHDLLARDRHRWLTWGP